jgi:hypothetical protein
MVSRVPSAVVMEVMAGTLPGLRRRVDDLRGQEPAVALGGTCRRAPSPVVIPVA